MKQQLPFFNWSLKKAEDNEPDSFIRARIRIIYAILLFSMVKAVAVIGFGAASGQGMQVKRAVVALVIYIVLVKVLLYLPSKLKIVAHVMIVLGLIVIWTNVFIYAHKINLVTVQFVFMAALSSFYTLGNRFGIFYSTTAALPVVLFLVFGGSIDIYTRVPEELASPGFEIIVLLNFVSIFVAHYLFFEAIKVNLEEKEQLNLKLQLSIAEATQLAASRANFLSTMSHELRTPLNSVVGITELLLEDKPEKRQMENLELLQFSALDLLALINNVLDFNKLDFNKLEPENVPVPLSDLMQRICAALRIKASGKKIDLLLDIDERLAGLTVFSDPTRLSQVIYNLVDNAIRFTDKGGVTVKLDLAENRGQEVVVSFSVTDTGIGIHPDRHEKIFELFTQAESHTMREYGGTGLGLAIVKQVLALFKSSVQLESATGKGSRFFFTISFAVVEEQVPVETIAQPDAPGLSNLKVLIAEDNAINKLIIKKQLAKLGITPVMVDNGKQAYDAYLLEHFDAVFLDLHMPVWGGYETIEQIRALTDPLKAKAHVVAFTAAVTEQQKIFDAGFDDFLYKPVNMKDLHEKLEKITMKGPKQYNKKALRPQGS